MDKLNLYALCDEHNLLFSFATASADKDAINMYLHLFRSNYASIDGDGNKALYENGVRGCSIVRVANIDIEKHYVDNDFNCLMILKDFNFKENDNNGNRES